MSTTPSVLAWSSIYVSAGDFVLLCAIVGGWLASFVLAIVNPILIGFSDASTFSRSAHFAIWAVYVGSGLTVWVRGLMHLKGPAWLIPIVGVPIFAVSHFIMLLWIRRQTRLRKATASDT